MTLKYTSLEDMPEQHRKIAELQAYYSSDPGQIAQILGCHAETVRNAQAHEPYQAYLRQLQSNEAMLVMRAMQSFDGLQSAAIELLKEQINDDELSPSVRQRAAFGVLDRHPAGKFAKRSTSRMELASDPVLGNQAIDQLKRVAHERGYAAIENKSEREVVDVTPGDVEANS